MKHDELYRKIKTGPTFLLLGQDYLRLESGVDAFLSETLQKYGISDLATLNYNQIFETDASISVNTSLQWMQELCERLTTPQWLKMIASFPWNGVYTSAIDNIWMRAFRLEWRELQPLVDVRYNPSDPRNRLKLLCTCLFGNVNRIDENERPPLSKRELGKRNRAAVRLLERLPEIITTFGVLLIEGYAGYRDWLSLDDLALTLDDLETEQTHMFNVFGDLLIELSEHEHTSELIRKGKLILHDESLSSFFSKRQDFLQIGTHTELEENDRRIDFGGSSKSVPIHLWTRVSRSAIPLDDTVLQHFPKYSEDKNYEEFRQFLSVSATKPVWSAYYRGFAFTRKFEDVLLERVKLALKSSEKEYRQPPIVLHGQTGTGKTVALGALAYKIRMERKYPVLFIERKSQRPNIFDIDAFCKWAEDNKANNCLIIWDGMLEVEQYYSLARGLEARGRKIVVVGSSYKLDIRDFKLNSQNEEPKNIILAETQLTPQEIINFKIFLNRIDPYLNKIIEKKLQPRNRFDSTFLVALYRILADTRTQLRGGVEREVNIAEQRVEKFVDENLNAIYNNSLAQAFLKSGIISLEDIISPEFENSSKETTKDIVNLIGLIMVPGSFGIMVPIELLQRALKKYSIIDFISLLKQFKVFEWYEDQIGNIKIGPRNVAEAAFIVQSRFRGKGHVEVEFIKNLLLETKSHDLYENIETEFVIDLLKNLKPERLSNEFGSNPDRFTPYYRDLAETLGKIREEYNIHNPRFMLQEANFLREAVIKRSRESSPYTDTEKMLDKAIEIINLALSMIEKSGRSAVKLRGALLAELASIIGSKLEHNLTWKTEISNQVDLYDEVRKEVFRARSLDSENYYPIDVFSWVTERWIEEGQLSDQDRANAEADILHLFEMADAGEFGIVQRKRFDEKRLKIADLLNLHEMSEAAFQSLLEQGSSAGYYIKARKILGSRKDFIFSETLTDEQIERYWDAIDYLQDHRDDIKHDARCMYLLIRLWWIAQTGVPMFYREKQVLPFDNHLWLYFYGLLQDLMNAEDFNMTPQIKFLYGLTEFHLNNIQNSFDIFKELEREVGIEKGYQRVSRSYLVSENGQAKIFTGENVTWINAQGTRARVFVEELHREVLFIPYDFNVQTIRKHDSLGTFYIAFNFIGPIADPIPTRQQ